MPAAGNIVETMYTILNLSDAPLTGMTSPADIVWTLRRLTGASLVTATEPVSMSELGTTGDYRVSFTPQNSGLYVLQGAEINVNTGLRRVRFDFQVMSAGAVFAPSYSNAFCAETDIERWLQQPITASTKPTDAEATAFAESRAAALMVLCAVRGYPTTPATVTSGSRLEDLLRDANAIGAALDYRMAQAFGTNAAKATEQIEHLRRLWQDYYGTDDSPTASGHVLGFIELELQTSVSLSTSHVLSGDTTARADEGAPQDIGLQIRMGDVY